MRGGLIVLGALALAHAAAGCGGDECPGGSAKMGDRCVVLDADGGTVRDGATDGPPSSCTPEPGLDVPDPEGIDRNCDGIDGDVATSVFVATDGDDAADGTFATPVRTIGHGLALATERGASAVLIGVGIYEDGVTLADGVSLHGGYAPSTGWTRTADAAATVIRGRQPLRGSDLAHETVLTRLRLEALDADPTSPSSIGALLVRCASVRLEDVEIQAGRGASGASPAQPSPPPTGGMGVDGELGHTGAPTRGAFCGGNDVYTSANRPGLGGTTTCGCGTGGTGGSSGGFADGLMPLTRAQTGQSGALAGSVPACPSFTGAMGGGPGTTAARNGRDGSPGAMGSIGEDGAMAGRGVYAETGYTPLPADSGADGTPGAGGGGGGGGDGCFFSSDACNVSGGSGGGGGGGGCPGRGGPGGASGGASIALYLWSSNVLLVGVSLSTAGGGDGGHGALGGDSSSGGPGGAGGAGVRADCGTTGVGGGGGRGGDGGKGGKGAGGAGGPSVGVLLGSGSSDGDGEGSIDVTISAGPGGAAGMTGGGTAPSGAAGVSMERLVAP